MFLASTLIQKSTFVEEKRKQHRDRAQTETGELTRKRSGTIYVYIKRENTNTVDSEEEEGKQEKDQIERKTRREKKLVGFSNPIMRKGAALKFNGGKYTLEVSQLPSTDNTTTVSYSSEKNCTC